MEKVKQAHTPGPWHTFKGKTVVRQTDGLKHERETVAVVYGYGQETVMANAALIAAAPELLEALKEVRAYRMQTHHGDDRCLQIIDEAIAKAEGRV